MSFRAPARQVNEPFSARIIPTGYSRGQSAVLQTFQDADTGERYDMPAKAASELLKGLSYGAIVIDGGAFYGTFEIRKQGYRYALMPQI